MTEDEFVERVADAVADRIVARLGQVAAAPTSQLVDAAAVARALGVSRDLVYARAHELGAIRVGTGARPRLRFRLEQAFAAWTASSESKGSEPSDCRPARRSSLRARRTARSGRPLLPVEGLEE
jgi:hypothetical protein